MTNFIVDEQTFIGRLMLDQRKCRSLIASINPKIFKDKVNSVVLEVLRSHIAKYDDLAPTILQKENPELPISVIHASGSDLPLEDLGVAYKQIEDQFKLRSAENIFMGGPLDLQGKGLEALPGLVSRLNKCIASESLEEKATDSLVDMVFARQGKEGTVNGVPTGFSLLDKSLDGLQGGTSTIIAARPSVGKTSFILNICKYLADSGSKTVFFSYEMTKRQVAKKLFHMYGFFKSDFQSASLSPGRLEKMVEIKDKVDKLFENIIFDNSYPTKSVIEAKCVEYKEQGCKLFVFDYLQLIPKENEMLQDTQHLQEVSRALKLTAIKLDISIVSLSQLNREGRHRANKLPILEDLKSSGSIEQDADNVIMLHRENKRTSKLGVVIRKAREGEADIFFEHDYCLGSQLITEVKEVEEQDLLGEESEKPKRKGTTAAEYQSKD